MSPDARDALRMQGLRLQQRCHDAEAHVERLLAEIQQLCDEREWYDDQLRGLLGDFEWLLDEHPEHKGARSDDRIRVIRAALAGTPSEDTE